MRPLLLAALIVFVPATGRADPVRATCVMGGQQEQFCVVMKTDGGCVVSYEGSSLRVQCAPRYCIVDAGDYRLAIPCEKR